MIYIVAAVALGALAAYWSPSWTSGLLVIPAAVLAVQVTDGALPLLGVAGLAVAVGRGVRWFVAPPSAVAEAAP